MTQPQGPQYDPSQQPQYQQPQYQHPQYQQPQYQQPPQQPYGQQPYGQPQYQQPLQGRDRAQYVRQQTPHSLMKHLLFGWVLAWIPAIYYTVSKNHYWKF